ncbi:hypothetical protein [Candidatus Alkanophaga liquidiphilum]
MGRDAPVTLLVLGLLLPLLLSSAMAEKPTPIDPKEDIYMVTADVDGGTTITITAYTLEASGAEEVEGHLIYYFGTSEEPPGPPNIAFMKHEDASNVFIAEIETTADYGQFNFAVHVNLAEMPLSDRAPDSSYYTLKSGETSKKWDDPTTFGTPAPEFSGIVLLSVVGAPLGVAALLLLRK